MTFCSPWAMFNTGANGGGIFVEGHMALVVSAHNFSTPTRLDWHPFLFIWYCPDISDSMPKCESKEPLEEEEESDESSAHVEVPLLEPEDLDAVVLGAADLVDIARKDVA